MTAPPRTLRVVLMVLGLAVLLAGLAKRAGPMDERHALLALTAIGAVLALSARSALLLLAARARLLAVDAAAPRTHRLFLRALPAVLAGAGVGAALAFTPLVRWSGFTTLVVGVAGTASGLVFARVDPNTPRAPRTTSRFAFIVLDTALPAAIVASSIGVVVGVLRLAGMDVVPAGVIARHLGGTTFLYAIFLGLGGFLKTYSEQSAGLVSVAKTEASVPGPVLTGGVIGVAFLILGARFLPDLPVNDVLVLKGACGFVIGGLVSTLGAIQGARAASLGLRRRGRAPAPQGK